MSSTENEFNEMVYNLKKDGQDILDTLTPDKCDLIHMAMGVSSEGGELEDAIKKYVIYNKELDLKNVIEELGDLEFFMEGIRQRLNIHREDTLKHTMDKLLKGDKARYKEGKYSDQQAQARADKQAEEAKVTVILNGEEKVLKRGISLTYVDLFVMAYPDTGAVQSGYSVTYRNRADGQGGILDQGQHIVANQDMVINIVDTSAA